MIVCSFNLPFNFIPVVVSSSNAFANLVFAFPVQFDICSLGFLSVFCKLWSGLNSFIVVPLTVSPSLPMPRGSLLMA